MPRPRPTRDPAPIIIGGTVFFLVAVILILLLAPFSPLGGDDEGGEVVFEETGIRGIARTLPALPPQLEAVSQFVVFEAEEDVGAAIGIPLTQTLDSEAGLRFYSFLNGRWRYVVDVTLIRAKTLGESGCQSGTLGDASQGRLLACANFPSIPGNLAVLRVIAQAHRVAGSIPTGGSLHPDAVELLDIISPRDYSPESDGSISGTATEVDAGADVLLIPTIVGSDDLGAAAVADILADDDARQAHIDNVVELVADGNFAGIDLDYSKLEEASLRSQFTQFVTALAQRLDNDGRQLILTLPPATSDDEAGAYDWEALGQAADIIKILPLADPSTYWDEMPDALSFAVAKVDPQKLFLVVSPLSLLLQGTRVSTIGHQEAMLLATALEVRDPSDPQEIVTDAPVVISALNIDPGQGASGIRWSDDVASITFSFTDDGGTTTAFVENTFSVGFKLELVQAFGLGGVAVMDASAESDVANIWPAVRDLVDTGTAPLLRPNPDQLAPQWEAPDGDIVASDDRGSATWTAPSPAGTYTIVLIVSDGVLRFARELEVEVMEGVAMGPAQVTGLTVTPVSSGQLDLSWSANPEPDLDSYRVYRSTTSGGPYTLIATDVPVGTTSYADTGLSPSTTYYYRVSAVDRDGNEGPQSAEVFGTLPSP